MKKILLTLIALGVLSSFAGAQTQVRKENGYYVPVNRTAKSADTLTGQQVKIKNEIFPVYVSRNGKYYILRTSKKSGKEYRRYIQLSN